MPHSKGGKQVERIKKGQCKILLQIMPLQKFDDIHDGELKIAFDINTINDCFILPSTYINDVNV